jgi:hypothetical protein
MLYIYVKMHGADEHKMHIFVPCPLLDCAFNYARVERHGIVAVPVLNILS